MLLSVLPSDKPDFIWLHLDGRQSYAQTPLHRQATGGLSKLFSQAEQSRCMIVIDGPHHEVNWNQTLRQLFARHVEVSTVHWCGLGIRKINQEHRSNLVHAVHSVCVRNGRPPGLRIDSVPFACGKRISEKHDHDCGAQFDEFLVWLIGKLGLSREAIPRTIMDAPKKNMPLFNKKTSYLSLDSALTKDEAKCSANIAADDDTPTSPQPENDKGLMSDLNR